MTKAVRGEPGLVALLWATRTSHVHGIWTVASLSRYKCHCTYLSSATSWTSFRLLSIWRELDLSRSGYCPVLCSFGKSNETSGSIKLRWIYWLAVVLSAYNETLFSMVFVSYKIISRNLTTLIVYTCTNTVSLRFKEGNAKLNLRMSVISFYQWVKHRLLITNGENFPFSFHTCVPHFFILIVLNY
jgi:hypothetical protein